MASELKPCQIADALEKCDWAGASIGNKLIVLSAIDALRNTRPAPAATYTGLETGLWTMTDVNGKPTNVTTSVNDAKVWLELGYILTEYVTRSQAEELLAAERAESVRLSGIASEQMARAEKAEADNAAQAARIKELEQALETEKTLSRGDWACQREVDQMSIKVEALEAKLAAAEKSGVRHG